MIANHCDHTNGNTLNAIFPTVPNGSQIIKWNCQSQTYEPTATYNNGAWVPNLTLDPGEGAWFVNPGPAFTATISGVAHTPTPLNIPPNACCMVSRQEPLSGGVGVIVPLQDGDGVWRWNGFGFTYDFYAEGMWQGDSGGNEPIVGVGEFVWYCRDGGIPPPPCSPVQIVQQPSSFDVCCTNATNCAIFSVAANGTTPLSYQWYVNGTLITGATTPSYSVCPATAADNGKQYTVRITNDCGSVTSQVATLTVVFDTTPPVITCPTNLTVQCDAYVPPPNPALVSAIDNCGPFPKVTHVSDVASGTCPKTIVRTYKATDMCGNVATCTQTITVHDTIPPALGCVNLVPNPSFEKTTSCPDNWDQVPLAAPWFKPTGGTSDFFHVCSSEPGVGVPDNGPGYQAPRSGQGYVGGVHAGGDYREYVESPLMAPLVAGRTYEVSFYVSLAENYGYAVDNLGAYLSVGPVLTGGAGPLLLTPQVQNPAGSFLNSHTNWMLVQGTFTASGGEDHITIGNFYNDSNTPVVIVPAGVYALAYYYFDDVSVREACEPTNKIVQCGSAWTFDPPVALDACSGSNVTISVLSTVTNGICPRVITRTWQAMDACSNTATWSQSITFADTNPPVINCPTNLTVVASVGQNGATVNFSVTATDVCDGVIPVTCVPAPGFFSCGVTNVTCVAVDACGNSNSCSFTVTVQCGRADLFVEDTPYNYNGLPDQGFEPDPNMVGKNMWLSRGIWVHENCALPAGTYLTHQNPRYGQTNCVFVNVTNRGTLPLAGANLQVWFANANLGLSWPASWTLLGLYPLPTMNPATSHIAQLPWSPPGAGHYCLLARILSPSDPMAAPEGFNIGANVRANNNLAWRNVNVAECLRTPARKVQVRARNVRPGNGLARSLATTTDLLTIQITADQDFLTTGGEVALDLGALFARWQAGGSRGTNIVVTSTLQIRCTGTPARVENIAFAADEERIFNLTLRANEPMPGPGTNRVYHVGVIQEVDGEAVGGIDYAVVTRAQDTDTDHDGDGIPDSTDANPLGEPDCEATGLTVAHVGTDIVLTWSGLDYRLQAVNTLGQAWADLPARSPLVLPVNTAPKYFRLVCP